MSKRKIVRKDEFFILSRNTWSEAEAKLLASFIVELNPLIKPKIKDEFNLTTEEKELLEAFNDIEFEKMIKTIDELELYRVKDYKIHQPLTYRLFGLSKIEINTSDRSHPIVFLDGLEDAPELLNLIRHNVENMRSIKRVSAIDFEA